MTDTPSPSPSPRRWWPRFSLRTLMLTVMLSGLVYGLHSRWGQAWVSAWVQDWSEYEHIYVAFSRDGSRIHLIANHVTVKDIAIESGKVVERESSRAGLDASPETTSAGNELVWEPAPRTMPSACDGWEGSGR